MIGTSVMIRLGRVKGNRMVDMQLSNHKLIDRGTRMVMDGLKVSYEVANGRCCGTTAACGEPLKRDTRFRSSTWNIRRST